MTRTASYVAIALGALAGSGFALLRARSPERPAPSSEASSRNTRVSSATPEAPLIAASAEPTPPALPTEPARRTAIPPATNGLTENLDRAKLLCDYGVAADCLGAARGHRETSPSDKRARAFYARAVGMYATECRKRDPVACSALARLYDSGEGVAADPEQARALTARVRELCRIHSQPICAKLADALDTGR